MSTRSTIHFKDNYGEAIVYRHQDGYEAIGGADILLFLDTYSTRPNDYSYTAAHFLVYLAAKMQNGDDRLDFMSVGICDSDPGDIEYRYTVWCDGSGRVEVEHMQTFFDAWSEPRRLTWESIIQDQDDSYRLVAARQQQGAASSAEYWAEYRPLEVAR